MPISYSVSPSVARALGMDRVNITLANWGNVGPAADMNFGSVQQDLGPVSFSGLGIDPTSEIDHLEMIVGDNRGVSARPSRPIIWTVSPESPYVGEMPSGILLGASPPTKWNDRYLPLGGVTPTPFVDQLNPAPSLKLIAWLRPDAIVPAKRCHIYRHAFIFRPIPVGPDLVELHDWPVFGRKKVRVSFKVSGPGGSSVDLYVTGVPCAEAIIVGDSIGVEQVLAGPVTVPANTQKTFVIDDLFMSFLMPKVKHVSGTPSVWVEMEAAD